ncbi:MAG TPA: histidine kinase [Vicinamibacterales bacterium]|jgi:two-component system LytT family sensor kinase|nr:histidine kinase [Vicinamibacterales bacterium]
MPHEIKLLSGEQYLLTTLMVKLAVVAVLATMLVRFPWFRRILLTEKRDWPERLVFAASLGVPLTAGVVARLLLNYDAADLTLAGSFLAGLLAGPYAGAIVGAMVGIPALVAHEWIALPFAIGCGFAGGGLREICPKEAIWHFSPLFFTDLHRNVWRLLRRFEIDWVVVLLAAPVGLEIVRQTLGNRFGSYRIFYFAPPSAWLYTLVVLATVLCVAIPIKIWNSARIEHRLQEQEKLLMATRLEALASQINPHFLFNTLTSISSLIRSQPETARMLIVKLSGLLRRLLRSQEHFVTLREELEAIDEYLDIEAVRFGPKLRIEKDIAPDSLDVVVPSMLLQPLVENSIKHGLSPKIGAGRITIRSTRQNGHAIIDVIDDGVGVSPGHAERVKSGDGIGLKNVNERLRVIYGANYQLHLDSVPGEGTCARVVIPELVVPARITA